MANLGDVIWRIFGDVTNVSIFGCHPARLWRELKFGRSKKFCYFGGCQAAKASPGAQFWRELPWREIVACRRPVLVHTDFHFEKVSRMRFTPYVSEVCGTWVPDERKFQLTRLFQLPDFLPNVFWFYLTMTLQVKDNDTHWPLTPCSIYSKRA